MTDSEAKEAGEKGNGPVPEEPQNEPAPEAAAPEAEPQVDPLAEAKAEIAKLKDQLLRTAADFDNFRKRSRREVGDAEARSREDVLRDLLPVFDNLDRAMAHAENATSVQSLAEGIRMVQRQFVDTLGKMGVTRVEAVGTPFDPAIHEAIQHIESAEFPPGTIAAEARTGYRHGERLLRPALVVVAKAAAAPEAQPAAEEPAEPEEPAADTADPSEKS